MVLRSFDGYIFLFVTFNDRHNASSQKDLLYYKHFEQIFFMELLVNGFKIEFSFKLIFFIYITKSVICYNEVFHFEALIFITP